MKKIGKDYYWWIDFFITTLDPHRNTFFAEINIGIFYQTTRQNTLQYFLIMCDEETQGPSQFIQEYQSKGLSFYTLRK